VHIHIVVLMHIHTV